MEQFDQLLTCGICLDRFRTPKLLPCQHSYCMDPCMEGLVDYVKRQIKCPECRAEHRIPYNGSVQGFPTNFTLQKFLELHSKITGEMPDPNADGIMLRCNVCQEKAYVFSCSHCEKKICSDCKDAHCDVLKREINRINSQLKRSLNRIEDCVKHVDKNKEYLKANAKQVIKEVEENNRRLVNLLHEKTSVLKQSVDAYLESESATLKDLKRNLSTELVNIKSNCEIIDNYLMEGKWDDNELMDCKEIFLKMMDFVRNYDPGSEEYSRRIRLIFHESVDEVARRVSQFSEVKFFEPRKEEEESASSATSSSRAFLLSRSKSDHRLVSEMRNRDLSPPTRRRFGDTRAGKDDRKKSMQALDDDEEEDCRLRGRFRSRFLRPEDDDRREEKCDTDSKEKLSRQKVIDTEDISRGPLSGCIRLADSSRIIMRIKELEMQQGKEGGVKPKPALPQPQPTQPAEVKKQPDPTPAAAAPKQQFQSAASTSHTPKPAASTSTSASAGEDEYEYYSESDAGDDESEDATEDEPSVPSRSGGGGGNSFVDRYLSGNNSDGGSSSRNWTPLMESARSQASSKPSSSNDQSSAAAISKNLAKSKSSHVLASTSSGDGRNNSDSNLSSWGQYLKAKYSKRNESSSVDQSNAFAFGARGSKEGEFTWPRGLAVGPRDTIAVADSSNHRVQIFQKNGEFISSFGSYGNGEGEFDCLAGININSLGHYIIADRYNHRIQVFDADENFLRSFGSQGTADGRFNYPWGVTSDSSGFVYICDKENHRVQIFQPDGTFVGKLGAHGKDAGHLEHPHYIAVNAKGHIIVSDSNNHRVQVFDVSGRVISAFGSEGTDHGQLKFPRGIALDDSDCVYVADSGNNRVQVFSPDGQRIRSFGKWGCDQGEFKGLEGIAVNSRKDIIVADRENHRIQVFLAK